MQPAENLPIPVSVQYDLSDLRAVNFLLWRRWIKIGLLIALVIVGLNIILPILEGVEPATAFEMADWASLMPVPIIVLLMVFLSPFLSMRARRKNNWDIPLRYVATPDVLSIEHEQGKTETRWEAIRKIEVTKDRLFLFTTPACAYILHRRSFSDESSFNDWIAFARKAISDAKSIIAK